MILRIRPRGCGGRRRKSAYPGKSVDRQRKMQGCRATTRRNGKGLVPARVLRRRGSIIVAVALLTGAAAAALAQLSRDTYESTATLVFRQTIAPQLNSIGLIPNTVAARQPGRRQPRGVACRGGRRRCIEALAVAASTCRSPTSRTTSPCGREDQRRRQGHRLRGRRPARRAPGQRLRRERPAPCVGDEDRRARPAGADESPTPASELPPVTGPEPRVRVSGAPEGHAGEAP